MATIFLSCASSIIEAQNPTQPQRGFYPGGSYALSDIETVNTSNGNVILRIPLVSLPPGRSGPGGGVGLYYNSKVYETYSYEDGRFEDGSYSTILRASDSGGWRYGFKYEVQLVHRYDENQPTLIYCGHNDPADTYVYKLKMKFPDGSEHIFRPSGYTDYNGDNFFRMRPDGWMATCGQPDSHVVFTGMTYYSADGTFMRLSFAPDGGNNWMNIPWTLSLPDGTRVTGGGSNPERIYDRNNNYVEIRNITYNGHPASEIADQLGRHIVVEYGPPVDPNTETARDYIHAWRTENGQLTELIWTIKWRSVSANNKTYYMNPNDINIGSTMFGPGYAGIGEIDLPVQAGGLSYSFTYNVDDPTINGWGEVGSMTLPSGAQVRYQYATNSYTLMAVDVLRDYVYTKDLTYLLECDGTSTPTKETWQYNLSETSCQVTAPDGGISNEHFRSTWGDAWDSGLSYKTENPDGSVIERVWRQNIPYGYGSSTPAKANSYIKTEFTSIRNGAGMLVKTAIKDYTFDKNGNVTQEADYDWVDYGTVPRDSNGKPTGVIPASAQIRRVISSTYYSATPTADSAAYSPSIYTQGSAAGLRNAVASGELSDGVGTILSRTEFTYDDPATTGNLTQKTSWDSTKGAYSNPLTSGNSISVSSQYTTWSNGNTGKLIQTTDARGTMTALTYGSVGGFDLYPTQIVMASGTSIARTESRAYDFATGLVTSVTDADNNVTTSTTYDVFGRPTLVKAADGKPEETRTATEYSDVNRRVIVRSDLNTLGDGKLVKIEHYDQLGRVRLMRQLEDSATQSATDETTGIKVQTRYLFSGANSYVLSSNPYRANYSYQESDVTMGWTRSKSDNSGRVVEVQTFGGSTLPAPWGSSTTSTGTVTTAYDANFTTVTDQAGKVRRSMTNGLGQLARVDEPDANGNLGSTDSAVQPTAYDYDGLNNLLHAYQGSQTRTFTYSSLARLLTASNPESRMINYQYDDGGNLTQKTDARNVTTTYIYDALNRATSRSYSDSTPAVTYSYDSTSITYGRGRLALVSSSVSSYSYSGYDPLGRALGGTQTIGSQNYSISNIVYDRAGHVTSMTYPSNHSVTFNYDAAGRLGDKDSTHLAFTGNLGDGTSRTYSQGLTYAAAGQMTQEQFGTSTAVFNKLNYNSRNQLIGVLASTSGNDTTFDRGKIVNDYGTTDNNGNLKQQTVYVPNDQNTSPTSWYQQYGYDSLNRLTQVHEYTGNTSLDWQQAYTYDRWGNRLINNSSNATWGDGINNVVATIDATNNRMLAVNDPNHMYIDYDAAGNQTKDYLTSNGTRTYDAENRMIQTVNSANQTSTYSYDGDGRRVKRSVPVAGQPSPVETWQVYGLAGELIAEYPQNGSYGNPQKEYGYRNGQLLVTATVTTGWGTAPTLNDNPLTAGQTTVQARHITELRTAINALRSHLNLSAYSWQYSATTNDYISANPILEMRTALDQALGAPSGGYSAGLAQNQLVMAIHIQELRNRVLAAWQSGSGVDIRWMVTDQLGTPRMIFDQSGSLANVSRHDYLPFGEELFAGTGGRTPQQGYGAGDGVRQHFTQKERDTETGLDYFGYRYFASTQGRWTSVDPLIDFEKNTQEPQAWNSYQYCLNNPLTRTDPDGRQDSIGLNGTHAIEQELRRAGYNEQQIKVFMDEYRKGQTRALKITVTTLAGLTIAPALRQVGTVILTWMARNPDTVNQLEQDALQMSTGSPAPASVPRLNPEAIDQFGTSIAQEVSGMSRGQMGTIATRVSECGLNQADAVDVVQTAIQKVGKSSIAVPQANGSVVVASVQAGANKPILIVNQQGVVSQARATISAGIRKGKAFFEVTNITTK